VVAKLATSFGTSIHSVTESLDDFRYKKIRNVLERSLPFEDFFVQSSKTSEPNHHRHGLSLQQSGWASAHRGLISHDSQVRLLDPPFTNAEEFRPDTHSGGFSLLKNVTLNFSWRNWCVIRNTNQYCTPSGGA
jgi:hypothetical protein